MKTTILAKLVNKRRSPANGSNTSSVGGVTSLILLSGAIALYTLVSTMSLAQSVSAATITMSSSGAQSIDVMSNSNGSTGTSIGVDNLNIVTDCRAGYNLSISTSVNDNNLYLNGSSSNNTSGTYFTPADGSSTLVGSPNTWGYLVSDSAPTASSTFSAVPVLSSPSTIRTTSQTASTSDINDNIDIYYGVAVSNGLAPGTYKMIPDTSSSNGNGGYNDGAIIYYLTMESSCDVRDVVINAGKGISTLTADGWTDSGTGTITKSIPVGTTIDLSSIITPTYITGYNGISYNKTGGEGILSGSSYTVGSSDTNTITIAATGLDTPVCTMTGGTTKVYNRSATNLTATDNSTMFDTSNIDLTYSFGYASNGTNDLANFGSAQTSNILSVNANAYRGARYYGVTVTATDKTDSSMTSTCTSGTVDAAVTGTTVDNRTTLTLVNSRINFDATTNGGTLSGTSPVYVYYKGTATYSSRTGSSSRAIPTATKSGYTFTGWWTAASGGNKVINADGTLTGTAVSGWTNASKQWVKTGTSNSATATANQLYAQFEVGCTAFSGYMQDMTAAIVSAASIGDCGTLTDSRDSKTYSVAKLADGKLWMTSNLNLAGGTVLSSDKSDVPSTNYYTLPASTTISSGTSVQSGQFSSDTTAYVFNTGNNTTTCNSSTPCTSYYSWIAATAGGKDSSGNAVSTNGYNTAYSICPKGWRLPTSTTSNANAQTGSRWKTGDGYALATAYGANLESSYSQNAATFYNNAGPGTTPNFLLAGYYYNGSFYNGGSFGLYWSSTAYSSSSAYYLSFGSGSVNSASYHYRRFGTSVRCVYGS